MDRTDEVVLDTIAVIGRVGVAIIYVGGGDGAVPFAYTAGLTEKAHPELLLAGPIPPAYAQQSLNDLSFRVIKDGARFKAGDRLDDVIEGYDVVIAGPVGAAWDEMYPASMAKAIYGQERAGRPLQVVYPDRHGKFPWDDGYSMASQPLLCPTPPGV